MPKRQRSKPGTPVVVRTTRTQRGWSVSALDARPTEHDDVAAAAEAALDLFDQQLTAASPRSKGRRSPAHRR